MFNYFVHKGYKLLHVQTQNTIITTRVIVNAGSIHEVNHDDYGVAHFLEHMLFKGTKNKTRQQINNEITSVGGANAYTSEGRTCYYIESINDKFEKTFNLLCEIFFNATLPNNEFEVERNVILEEIQSYLDDPHVYYLDTAYNMYWGDIGHPIAGTLKSVEKMELSQLIKFKQKHYTKENVVFIVCGDISPCECGRVFKDVIDQMGNLENGKENKLVVHSHLPTYKWSNINHISNQSVLGLWFPTTYHSKNINYVDELYDNIIAGADNSLFYERLREDLGLCYSSSIRNVNSGYNNKIFMCKLNVNNIKLAYNEILKILNDIAENGISKSRMDIAKSNYLFSVASCFETASDFASEMLDSYFYEKYNYNYFKDIFYDGIKEVVEDLSIDDVKDFAKQFKPNNVHVITMNGEE